MQVEPRTNAEMYPLSHLAVGEVGQIVRVDVNGPVRRRFLDLGLVNGVAITLIQIAPLGDPLVLEMRGYRLTMRKADAGKIWVKKI